MTSVFAIICITALDAIAFYGIKRAYPNLSFANRQKIMYSFVIQTVVAVSIVLFGVLFQRSISDYRLIAIYYQFFGGVAAVYIPKSIYALFLFVDWIIKKKTSKLECKSQFIRNIPIAKYGLWTSLSFILVVIWGILVGQYRYTIETVDVRVHNLPQAFDGFKIVQISDIHAGSFGKSTHRLEKAIDLINAQNPDIVVMTGDIVNNFAEELIPLIPVFSIINSNNCNFAVLGNHDYGGYYNWKTPTDSVRNITAIKNNIKEMGFTILNNQAVTIKRDADSIALIGVENWGILKRFPKRADLVKAMSSVRDVPVKMLITHDPSLWEKEIEGKTDIVLTLAGHTHGMQMGIKIGNKRFSPAPLMPRFRRHWAGLYKTQEQYLYINRGLGVVGMPIRMGMPPEITIITLRKS